MASGGTRSCSISSVSGQVAHVSKRLAQLLCVSCSSSIEHVQHNAAASSTSSTPPAQAGHHFDNRAGFHQARISARIADVLSGFSLAGMFMSSRDLLTFRSLQFLAVSATFPPPLVALAEDLFVHATTSSCVACEEVTATSRTLFRSLQVEKKRATRGQPVMRDLPNKAPLATYVPNPCCRACTVRS